MALLCSTKYHTENLLRAAHRRVRKNRPVVYRLVRLPLCENCFGEFHRWWVVRRGEGSPDLVIVVNQHLSLCRRAIRGGVRIFCDGDVISPTDAIFKSGIDAVIGRTATDNKMLSIQLR
ncbi:hypothetical protein D3C85_1189160 [compost metagenome]